MGGTHNNYILLAFFTIKVAVDGDIDASNVRLKHYFFSLFCWISLNFLICHMRKFSFSYTFGFIQ